jgi:hypothetical protein
MSVSHLTFADDLVIFTKGHRGSIRRFFLFLEDYENATGQKINREKSFFITSKLAKSRVFAALTGMTRGRVPHVFGTEEQPIDRCSLRRIENFLLFSTEGRTVPASSKVLEDVTVDPSYRGIS